MSQAANTNAVEPTARAMSLVTRKMPVPMVSPMTMATADQRPRPRTSSERGGCERFGGSGLIVLIEFQGAYYQIERRSIRAAASEKSLFFGQI